jgi:hypothetical protein
LVTNVVKVEFNNIKLLDRRGLNLIDYSEYPVVKKA